MSFWDSSAVVPLCVYESQSESMRALLVEQTEMVAWWATLVECEAAIARQRRSDVLSDSADRAAQERLRKLAKGWLSIDLRAAVRDDTSSDE